MTNANSPRYGVGADMLVVRTVVLLAFGATAGYVGNAIRPDGVPLAAYQPPHACSVEVTDPASVLILSATDAASAIDAGSVLLLDARTAELYQRGHVDGAMHLPCTSASHDAERMIEPARSGAAVIVYGEAVEDARPMAEEIARRIGGGLRISVVDGGYEALVEAGAAAESGSCERCTTDGMAP